MCNKKESPYLNSHNRLGDVISAIQAMAVYKFYKLDFQKWADRIGADNAKADYWKNIFLEHPEFFRLNSAQTQASLVWRRQRQKLYDVDTENKITKVEFKKLTDTQKKHISRMPLESDEIAILINTAVDLHSRAIEHKQEKRWWVPIIATLAGVIIGACITAYFGSSTSTSKANIEKPHQTINHNHKKIN